MAHDRIPSLPRRQCGQFYRGVNVFVLWMTMAARGDASPYFMTYRQIAEHSGQMRKGGKATTVVYANKVTKTEENEAGEAEARSLFVYKAYSVLSVHQADGLPEQFFPAPPPLAAPREKIAEV